MQFCDYKIIRYTPAYREPMLELLSLLWGATPQDNAAYLDWKYNQNPYSDRNWLFLVLYKDCLVGVRGNLAMRWQFGEPIQKIDCLCDGDSVVLPDHRRKGLYQALTEFNLQEMEDTSYRYTITLNANARTRDANLKMGWRRLSPITPLYRFSFQPVRLRIGSNPSHEGYL